MPEATAAAEAAAALRRSNPQLVAAIARAGDACTIVAWQDVVDEAGVQVLARHRPVPADLPQRLEKRRLMQPIEACLLAHDGVTTRQLECVLADFLDSDDPWAPLARRHAIALGREMNALPLHPAAQLLLSTMQATRAACFAHALRAMCVAGALFAREISERQGLRLALLGGLLHDIGELYLEPNLPGAIDLPAFRTLATHPCIGESVLARLTDYPGALGRAVGEHHERLDGSGYPGRRVGSALSLHGRLLAVVETALGVMGACEAPARRAALALRLVPGEFDAAWAGHGAGHLSGVLAGLPEDGEALVDAARPGLLDRLAEVDRCMLRGRALAVALVDGAPSPRVAEIAARSLHLLDRLRDGWNAAGLWSPPAPGAAGAQLLRAALAQQELSYRLSRLARDGLWAEENLPPGDADSLVPLWASAAPAGQGESASERLQ